MELHTFSDRAITAPSQAGRRSPDEELMYVFVFKAQRKDSLVTTSVTLKVKYN